jgi:hypothetical protein
MSKDFFIMLRNGDKAMPIVDENEDVMLYESKYMKFGGTRIKNLIIK